jgi:hypothetical protein
LFKHTNTRGGVTLTELNALTVKPWRRSPSRVVTTVTPLAKRLSTLLKV